MAVGESIGDRGNGVPVFEGRGDDIRIDAFELSYSDRRTISSFQNVRRLHIPTSATVSCCHLVNFADCLVEIAMIGSFEANQTKNETKPQLA
jgi:hypothetical protein